MLPKSPEKNKSFEELNRELQESTKRYEQEKKAIEEKILIASAIQEIESKTPDPATVENSNNPTKQLAYKYRVEIFDGNGFAYRNTITITEYFIPSHHFVFNPYGVFKSDNPRNMASWPSYSDSRAVTATQISSSLIDKMVKIANQKFSPSQFKEIFANNEEFQSLFTSKPPKTMLVGNIIEVIKGSFWERYEEKGNNVIKKALVKYIRNGETPKDVSLNDIYNKISTLSEVERQSIVDTTKSSLSLEDGKIIQKRLKDIDDVEGMRSNISTGVLSGATSGALAFAAESNPILGGAIGFFGGYAASYLSDEYTKYKINRNYDQQELRAKEVLDVIDCVPKNETRLSRC